MFSNQKKVYAELKKYIGVFSKTKIITLTGRSGIGKSYIIERFLEEIKDQYTCPICYIKGDQFCQNREYYCIKQALSQLIIGYNKAKDSKSIIADCVQDIPYIGTVSNKIISDKLNKQEIELKKKNYCLNEEELGIIYRLNYLFDKRSSLIVCDNLQYFDSKSLEFIYILITSKQYLDYFFDKTQLIFIYTEVDKKRSPILQHIYSANTNKIINMDSISYDDMEKILQKFGCHIELEEEIKKILFKLSDGHLEVIKHVASQINHTRYKLNESNNFNNGEELLEELINDKLIALGASGFQISELLEYASLIGKTFSNNELSTIVELNRKEFLDAIQNSDDMELISIHNNYSNFSHDIIQLLFRKRANSHQIYYYERMRKCIRELYPSEYARRIEIEQNLGELNKASILIALLCAKHNYNLSFQDESYNQILSLFPDISTFLQDMHQAYEEYINENYEIAISILDTIDDFLPIELLAERDLLKSITLTKILNESLRQQSVQCIKGYTLKKLNNEGDVYLRIQLSLISSYVHISEIAKAKKCEKKISKYLQSRIRYDENALYIINVLRRKSNSMHECVYAEKYMQKSVQYFAPITGQNAPLDPIQYLMSLGNYAGILIECGRFKESLDEITKAQELITDNEQIVFPRTQIIDNNCLIGTYLMNNSVKAKVLDAYESLMDLSENADNIFIMSNYCALLSVNGKIDDAYNILENQYKQFQSNNSEAFYKLCIINNLLVLKLFKKEFIDAQELLDDLISQIDGIIDESYYRKKFELFQKAIYDNLDISPEKIDTFLFEYCEHYQEAWAYWGRSFDYTALYYWSDM